MAIYEIDENGNCRRKDGNNSGLCLGLPVGTVFSSAIPIKDRRVHLLDGSLIEQNGIYREFAELIKSLVNSGEIASCTESEFNSEVATYNQCGKFVVDDVAGTIRLPKITEFIASSNGGDAIGLAELDMFKSHAHGVNVEQGNYTVVQNGNGNWCATYSNKSTLSTGGDETRPKNVRYPYYIVLAAGYRSEQDIDLDSILTKLDGKQNNLSAQSVALNTTRIGQNDTVVEYYMSSDGNTWYRKWASGWKEFGKTILSDAYSIRVDLPSNITFSNSNYTLELTCLQPDARSDNLIRSAYILERATTYFSFKENFASGSTTGGAEDYVVCYCCGF